MVAKGFCPWQKSTLRNQAPKISQKGQTCQCALLLSIAEIASRRQLYLGENYNFLRQKITFATNKDLWQTEIQKI
jgi:hypothetical protein